MSKKYPGGFVTNLGTVGYSVFFDGTGDYLVSASSASNVLGSGDFTIEFWLYPSNTSSAYRALVSSENYAATTGGWSLYQNGTNIEFWLTPGTVVTLSATSVITASTWQHVALCRASGTLRLFINGTQVQSVSNSTSLTGQQIWIGDNNSSSGDYFFNGYLSNVRVVIGTALYTAAFTPPTQLLNVTNTSLLTCNSPAIVDQSNNAFAITVNGNTAVSTFTPFPVFNPTPTSSAAPGIWSLDQALQYTQQGIWPLPPNYIEDVFSTYLFSGVTGGTQTITNGIDLLGKGGLVWNKLRSGSDNNYLVDSARGTSKYLSSNDPVGEGTQAQFITAFNNNGFSFGTAGYTVGTVVSWTFREQAKFFDVVTWTGNGTNPRNISHNLGSAPGCIIVKRTDISTSWNVYHRSAAAAGFTAAQSYLNLNNTNAASDNATMWADTAPTSTVFTVGSSNNASGGTYVAYLFAHDAGGFGSSGNDNVISCGSFTTSGTSVPEVNLGYEPQWVLIKSSVGTSGNWVISDNMRGLPVGNNSARLLGNTSGAETTDYSMLDLTATGFKAPSGGSNPYAYNSTYIYIAIRRGPMKTPTSGTSVFSPVTYTGNGAARTLTSNFPVDLEIVPNRDGGQSWSPSWLYRLAGNGVYVVSSSTAAEVNESANITNEFQSNVGVNRTNAYWNTSSQNLETFMFRRAPGFFDVVCYEGTSANRTLPHNLAAVPELMIIKERNNAGNYWQVYSAALGNGSRVYLNTNDASEAASAWNNTTPTSTVFSLGTSVGVNGSGRTYINYLFATVPGVSKVGSYTGTGTTQVINCGFTAGARFILIKRTDSTGDWYVWDSARGIVAGNDPYLLMNSSAAEVTNTDYVDTANSGFEISSTAPAAINANGGTFIFLAIA
jgi:hypothetical protein